MKKLCNILSVAVFVMMAMNACSPNSLLDDNEMNLVPQSALQGRDLANNLLASFGNSVTRNAELIYPNYYGGMYLDDNGTLIILSVSDNPNSYKNEFVQRCQGNNFILRPCKYSLNELNDGIDAIKKVFNVTSQSSLIEELHLKSFWLSEKENEIHIGLSDCSEENMNRFKAVCPDLPPLVFEQINEIEYQVEIDAGTPINSQSGGSKSSLGYRAKYGNEIGFVVAAHAMVPMGIVSLQDNKNDEIGQCKIIDKSVDAAFCALFSPYTASNMTYDFTNLTSNIETVMWGDKVSICGRYNNGSGTVLSTNYSYVGPDATVIYGAIQATYNSQNGDSGAVVYTTNHNIAGMHSAALVTGATRTAVFVPAASINKALSLTMY